MRRKFKVVWAGPARLDLVEIAEFIAVDNPATAREVVRRIREKTLTLHFEPERGRVVPELATQGITRLRELIVSPWRVLYQIDAKTVFVVLLVDSRRNLEDVLFRRLLR
jgi:plasmid stabilization system protein ParE